MERLPDTNYVEQTLSGVEPKSGIKQPSPFISQGEDLQLSFFIQYEGKPVTMEDWKLEAIVKKLPQASNVLWRGLPNLGLYKKDNTPGFFYILMPSDATSYFLPGTYYLDIKGCQRINSTEEVRDLTRILLSTTFNIRLTAGSPNPKLRPFTVSEAVLDPLTGISTITVTSVEPTLPEATDISSL